MSGLDSEEMIRLRALDVAVTREEIPSFADLAWLIERAYDLASEVETLESQGTTEAQDAEDRAQDAEDRETQAENRLEQELQRVRELERSCADLAEERDHYKAKVLIREGTAGSFSHGRLRFLQSALRASLESVERALSGDLPRTPKRKKERVK